MIDEYEQKADPVLDAKYTGSVSVAVATAAGGKVAPEVIKTPIAIMGPPVRIYWQQIL
jgi:hypothetical protein